MQAKRSSLISASDTKMMVDEISDILQLDQGDPAMFIETIRKLEKVVKAVPRMEAFIQSICK